MDVPMFVYPQMYCKLHTHLPEKIITVRHFQISQANFQTIFLTKLSDGIWLLCYNLHWYIHTLCTTIMCGILWYSCRPRRHGKDSSVHSSGLSYLALL